MPLKTVIQRVCMVGQCPSIWTLIMKLLMPKYLTRREFLGSRPLNFSKFSPHTFHLEKKTEVFSDFISAHPGKEESRSRKKRMTLARGMLVNSPQCAVNAWEATFLTQVWGLIIKNSMCEAKRPKNFKKKQEVEVRFCMYQQSSNATLQETC